MHYLLRFIQVVVIDILLSGDNAVVIALACRKLPRSLVNRGMVMGMLAAILARMALIFFAATLLALPFVRIIAALLLFWIAIKLLVPPNENEKDVKASTRIIGAVCTIIIADVSMSIDNVVAVASAVQGELLPAVLGILVSIPCIVWGSKILLGYIDRFPVIVVAGAGMLGWIAGGMWLEDPFASQIGAAWHYPASGTGIGLVLLSAWILKQLPQKEEA